MQWDVHKDCFRFDVTIKQKPITRRGILSAVSSVFDILGFIAPVTIKAKMLLQSLCRQRLGWDEAIPEESVKLWKTWTEELTGLSDLEINRCFKPFGGDVATKNSNLLSCRCFSECVWRGFVRENGMQKRSDLLQVSYGKGKVDTIANGFNF